MTPARREPGLLTPGIPALDLFPHATRSRLAGRFWRAHPGPGLLGYTDPAGFPALREAIAEHLGATRGLPCRTADVIVTSGSQVAIALAAGLLLDDGDAAWEEEPAYVAGRGALLAAGARLVPVDGDGLDVAAGVRAAPAARLALVTPSHQYPTGRTMTPGRRGAAGRLSQQTKEKADLGWLFAIEKRQFVQSREWSVDPTFVARLSCPTCPSGPIDNARMMSALRDAVSVSRVSDSEPACAARESVTEAHCCGDFNVSCRASNRPSTSTPIRTMVFLVTVASTVSTKP